jgi:hypothetical protein
MEKRLYLICFVIVLIGGCKFFKSEHNDEVVAKVGANILTYRDLSSVLPSGITQSDSISQSKEYIQRWIKQELMLRMAEMNLSREQKDFNRELEDFRSSLIIHKYQQQLLVQKLDTVVTENDIRQFYENHPEQFILEQNIVKAVYVELPKAVARPDQIKKWMLAPDDKSQTELEAYSIRFATKFDHFNHRWVDFVRIRTRLPFNYNLSEKQLKRNNFIEVRDAEKYYFVSIKDFRLTGEQAPFDFVKERIENLILNTRKMEFIRELEKNIYQKGKEEDLFQIMKR